MEQLLSMSEVAEVIGISKATLRTWRTHGRGPVGFKVGGRRVMYRRTAVEAWLAEQEAATASNSSRPTH
ncbi:AlpA family transcriptional regulator [Sanguibacter sp. HDW7]|uniref:helix-turn-helix transcriptional regulator n=1 Tax=Sanguibacter sp. HDW7 TaxID=2714931 RepID=UPI00140B6EED|nr:helix-turn-helix domain-containing protein [Sanguibacter sp. HDW7]QIK82636.1 helix-turn-helix domain-containing protein [Sanguibacter sp. HDW7]